MSSLATLSAASDDRKARLAKLKTLKRKQPADEHVAPESDREASAPAPLSTEDTHHDNGTISQDGEQEEQQTTDLARLHISGRNYDPEARGAKLGFENNPALAMEGQTLEDQAADIERELREKAAEDAKEADKGIDLFKLQPKKPNWDLKRDLDKKLEILNVRTDNAIAKIVREKIASKAAAGQPSGTAAVGNGANVDGAALVEGLRVREREEEEEERRQREDDEDLV